MRALIVKYDGYLRQLAERPPRQRLLVQQLTFAPLLVGFIVLRVVLEVLGVPFQIAWALMVVALALVIVFLWDAGSRIVRYGWAYDRTPADAPWASTRSGSVLIATLQRVSLHGLRALTLQTSLRGGMKFTDGDVSELLRLLAKDGHLEASTVERLNDGDPTIEAILGSMSVP